MTRAHLLPRDYAKRFERAHALGVELADAIARSTGNQPGNGRGNAASVSPDEGAGERRSDLRGRVKAPASLHLLATALLVSCGFYAAPEPDADDTVQRATDASRAALVDAGLTPPDAFRLFIAPLEPTNAERDAGFGVVFGRTDCRAQTVTLAEWSPVLLCHEMAHLATGCGPRAHGTPGAACPACLFERLHVDAKCAEAVLWR